MTGAESPPCEQRGPRRGKLSCGVVVFLASLMACACPHAQMRLLPAVTGLQNPVDIANARDGTGRLFIVEQAGRIRVAKEGQLAPTPFLDVTSLVQYGGEQGLLGLAFHPLFR